MAPSLNTARLQLRPCQMDDLLTIHQLWINADVRYYLFDDRVISPDEARSFLQDSATNFEQYGYGLWLVAERSSDCLIGFVGCLQSDEQIPSLIYGIHPDHWGKGYATEAAYGVLDYVRTLSVSSIQADVDEPNQASVRVLQKLGMGQTNRAIVDGKPLLYFEALL